MRAAPPMYGRKLDFIFSSNAELTVMKVNGEQEEMIRIDVRGMRGQEVFVRIRETVSQFCGKELKAEILTDDPEAIPKIKAFSSMSGCTAEVNAKDGHWSIMIEGDACSCR